MKQRQKSWPAQTRSLLGYICLRLRQNKYNNSKQLQGQTMRGIDRSQPRQEVVNGTEWDLGLAGPL